MSGILLKYLFNGYLKTLFKVILFFYCFGVILNLFEEVEFFKNQNTSIFIPLTLTFIYIPGLIIKLLPFIIFLSSLKFLMDIRNNRDLLSIKIFGFSNLKVFMLLATTSFMLGWIVLFIFTPLTSTMSKYYEKTKSNYSKDIDHLVTFNKNGLWIRESLEDGQRIISAENDIPKWLKELTIYNLDQNFNLKEKIYAEKAFIENNEWVLNDVKVITLVNGLTQNIDKETMIINSIYTHEKIISLYKKIETMSFLELIISYEDLTNRGYNKIFLMQNLHSMLSMPFFLFIMTSLACILMMNTLKRTKNVKIIIIGLIVCVIIYYLKDLSLALGQTNRIPLLSASWVPIIAISLFSTIGMLQINEK